jgi:hypothetical protein
MHSHTLPVAKAGACQGSALAPPPEPVPTLPAAHHRSRRSTWKSLGRPPSYPALILTLFISFFSGS